jgi:hypothetical protein
MLPGFSDRAPIIYMMRGGAKNRMIEARGDEAPNAALGRIR